MPSFARALHVGLTVRDMEQSAVWYQRVLGFVFVRRRESPDSSRILLLHPDSGFLIGLCNHRDRSGDRFDPLRTGLDHLAFEVADDAQLRAWVEHLDATGIEHSPIRELGHSRFVSLEDPDGIQIEIWQTITPHQPAADPATSPEFASARPANTKSSSS